MKGGTHLRQLKHCQQSLSSLPRRIESWLWIIFNKKLSSTYICVLFEAAGHSTFKIHYSFTLTPTKQYSTQSSNAGALLIPRATSMILGAFFDIYIEIVLVGG